MKRSRHVKRTHLLRHTAERKIADGNLDPQVIFLAYWHAFDVAGFFFGRDCGAQSASTMCVILIGSDKVRGSLGAQLFPI
jgi:hypothetical protein